MGNESESTIKNDTYDLLEKDVLQNGFTVDLLKTCADHMEGPYSLQAKVTASIAALFEAGGNDVAIMLFATILPLAQSLIEDLGKEE